MKRWMKKIPQGVSHCPNDRNDCFHDQHDTRENYQHAIADQGHLSTVTLLANVLETD